MTINVEVETTHQSYLDEMFKKIDANSLIVFDTNVLLNLYYINLDELEYLGYYLDSIKQHIWIPQHVYKEYEKNRKKKIYQIRDMVDQLLNFHNDIGKYVDNYFKRYEDFPVEHGKIFRSISQKRIGGIVEYIDYYKDELKGLKKRVGKLDYQENDDYFQLINTKIFSNVGPNFEEQELAILYQEAEMRFQNKIPPGYKDTSKDSNKYGDFIIWKQLINKSISDKKNIIFVSNDKKDDWKENGKCRPELLSEFHDLTNKEFKLLDLNELIEYTTISSKNIEECIYDIKEYRNENITTVSNWNKKFTYFETLDKITRQRREDYYYHYEADQIAYEELSQLRKIIECVCNKIFCGAIYRFRYALKMDLLIKNGELLELLCCITYKADTCLAIVVERNETHFQIAYSEETEYKKGFLDEILSLILELAYQNKNLSQEDLKFVQRRLKHYFEETKVDNILSFINLDEL